MYKYLNENWLLIIINNYFNKNKRPGCILITSLLTELRILNLGDNSLTGPIPSSITELSNLHELNLRNNNLDGNIPSNIGDALNLQIIDLMYNNLTGSIPSSFGNL